MSWGLLKANLLVAMLPVIALWLLYGLAPAEMTAEAIEDEPVEVVEAVREPPEPEPEPQPDPEPQPEPEPEPEPVGHEGISLVATSLESSIEVFWDPEDEEPHRTLTLADATSTAEVDPNYPLVFLVKDQPDDEEWLEVYLPVRPNGSSGFVRMADVELTENPFRIEAELTERVLRVYEDDELRLETPIGVGTDDLPTPGGVYYIKELLQPPDPNTLYGPYAFGLSGFSNVLDTFSGREAVIGIHGTNDPSSIGQQASSGCIRVPNELIIELVDFLPLGTPVEILS